MRAPARLKALNAEHTREDPNAHLRDGGAMWRAVTALSGTMHRTECEEEAETALHLMRTMPLPTNVSAAQWETRMLDFENEVNPALETAVEGVALVKMMMKSIPLNLEGDKRSIARDAVRAEEADGQV